jgi:hypothetical protein
MISQEKASLQSLRRGFFLGLVGLSYQGSRVWVIPNAAATV